MGALCLEQSNIAHLGAQRVVAAGDQAREHGLHALDGRLRLVVPRRPEPEMCRDGQVGEPDNLLPTACHMWALAEQKRMHEGSKGGDEKRGVPTGSRRTAGCTGCSRRTTRPPPSRRTLPL